jgi:hypothetical protein
MPVADNLTVHTLSPRDPVAYTIAAVLFVILRFGINYR